MVQPARRDPRRLDLVQLPGVHDRPSGRAYQPAGPVPAPRLGCAAMHSPDPAARAPSSPSLLASSRRLGGLRRRAERIAPPAIADRRAVPDDDPAAGDGSPGRPPSAERRAGGGRHRPDLEPVVDGLDAPLDIATRPGDDDTMLVAEQAGQLRVVRDGALVETPFLDIRDRSRPAASRACSGSPFHPDPPTAASSSTTPTRTGARSSPRTATDPDDPDLAAGRQRAAILLVMDDQFGNHNGGGLQFGPDGFLYIATGDGGGGGDPLDSGRDLDSLLAKILRIDVDVAADSDPPYGIPADNPFVDTGRRPRRGLADRPAQPLPLPLRPGDRRPVDRRCRPGRGRGDRRGPRRRRRPRLRLERASRAPAASRRRTDATTPV